MFLLQRFDLIALIGLFVQTFVAWIFVAVLASIRKGEHSSAAFDDFYSAFLMLSLALTVLSVRFFQTHELGAAEAIWSDGRWAATASYVLYGGLKALFGLLLVRGSYFLAGRSVPVWLRNAWWPLVALMAAMPLVIVDITPLLIVQAPVMVACALAALIVIRSQSVSGSGLKLVRFALFGLAVSWSIHAFAAATSTRIPGVRYLLALNSFVDLAVQLALGTGLIVSLLQVAHGRVSAAEEERARLQLAIDRDEKLRALGTLVSGVAHELNNPLTVIMGYADMLSGPAHVNPAAKIVGEQAERCRVIVRSLSALAGQSLHPLQNMSVAELVERVVSGLPQESTPDFAKIRVQAPADLRLNADRVGLEQVLSNLVINALQASPLRGEVLLAVTASRAGTEFSVTDAGPGVPHEHRERLFEPFFTTKPPGKGTGLGLAIADAIVHAHGGKITVEDAPSGRGACFRVVIPHAPASALEPPERAAQFVAARRLLIIDDDAAVRSVVRHQAQRRGWIVLEAESAEAALSATADLAQVDALLCDLRMPGIGGIGLHDRLHRENPQVLQRVVFVTGDLASLESTRFSQRSTRPLVAKPFDFDELFSVLARALPGGRG